MRRPHGFVLENRRRRSSLVAVGCSFRLELMAACLLAAPLWACFGNNFIWPTAAKSLVHPLPSRTRPELYEIGESRGSSAAMKSGLETLMVSFILWTIFVYGATAWTGEIRGRVVCDVCGDSSIGPEDHILEGAEVAVLCITKSGEVLNYQAFTDDKGIYTVAETMPESDRWDACLARPISSFSQKCSYVGAGKAGFKFTYTRPSGYHLTIRPFVYRPSSTPTFCM